MKDNKFRAWETLNQKMYYLDLALYAWNDISNTHKFALPPNRQSLRESYTMMNLDALKIMQYTGIKDRSGNNIYEGDVVKGKRSSHWHDGYDKVNAKVYFDQRNLSFCVKGLGGGHLYNIEDLEVLGNVYENEDLLKSIE